jgi:hypothetical protein
MLDLWNSRAKEHGFDGIYIVSGNTSSKLETRLELIDAFYNFEPGFSLKHKLNKFDQGYYYFRTLIITTVNKIFKTKLLERKINIKSIYRVNYKKSKSSHKVEYLGTTPMWDNTPRRGFKGIVYTNSSPDLFHKNLLKIKNVLGNNHENTFIYLNAWNEWGESCYLEPDSIYKFDFLAVIKKAK